MEDNTPAYPKRRDLRKTNPEPVKINAALKRHTESNPSTGRRSLRRTEPRSIAETFGGMVKSARESAERRRQEKDKIPLGTDIFRIEEAKGLSVLDPQLRATVNKKLSELHRPVVVGKRQRGLHKFAALPMPATKVKEDPTTTQGKILAAISNFFDIPDNSTKNHPLTERITRNWEHIDWSTHLTRWDDVSRVRGSRTAALHYMKAWEEGTLDTPLNVRIDMLQSIERLAKQCEVTVGLKSRNWAPDFASSVMRRDAMVALKKAETAIDNKTQDAWIHRYETLMDSASAVEQTKSLTPMGFFTKL